MKFAHILGAINGRVLLFIFYFLVIGIYSIVSFPFKLFKKKKSGESKNTSENTYWVEKNIEDVTEEVLLRQF
jgi:hypothetical protein